MRVAKPINPETEDLFPSVNIKRFIKWAIFGLIGFIITSFLVSILVVVLIFKYFIGPALNSDLPNNDRTRLEERLNSEEDRIKVLEEKIQQLELRSN